MMWYYSVERVEYININIPILAEWNISRCSPGDSAVTECSHSTRSLNTTAEYTVTHTQSQHFTPKPWIFTNRGWAVNPTPTTWSPPICFFTLWPCDLDLLPFELTGGRGFMMDNPCHCSFSRFGFIPRTNRQTDRHTDAGERHTPATIVGVIRYWFVYRGFCTRSFSVRPILLLNFLCCIFLYTVVWFILHLRLRRI